MGNFDTLRTTMSWLAVLLILAGFALIVIACAKAHAPIGHEDDDGFHLFRPRD